MRFISAFILFTLAVPVAAETPVERGASDPLQVTIYDGNLALVYDRRAAQLPPGESALAFPNVTRQVMPDTVDLAGLNGLSALTVVERAFDFDVLSPTTLLQRALGQTVEVVETNPSNGKQTVREATVLSLRDGLVLEIDGTLYTSAPGQIRFPNPPDDLRRSPTLTARVSLPQPADGTLGLSYLTSGLTWKADYTARLNADQDQLDLEVWATLTNTTGIKLENADVAVVSGSLNRVGPDRRFQAQEMAMMARAAPAADVAVETLSGYQLYRIERPVTVKDQETRQVLLVAAKSVPAMRTYVSTAAPSLYRQWFGDAPTSNAVTTISFENTEENGLGDGLPRGVVRLYGPDSTDTQRLLGESRVPITPKGASADLTLGEDSEISVERIQTDFLQPTDNIVLSSHRIFVRNAKPVAVTVRVEEQLSGAWEITDSSDAFDRPRSDLAVWTIEVPAEGQAEIEYRVRVRTG